MRRLVMTLMVCLLACAGVFPVSGQEPSLTVPPPPWFGGQRVERPEHGFALTVPDGWVAFDTAVDLISQLEAAAGYLDPDLWYPENLDHMADDASHGVVLQLGDARSGNGCGFGSFRDVTMPLADVVRGMADRFSDDPGYRDVEPAQSLVVPAGLGYVIRMSWQSDTDEWAPGSFFLLGERDMIVWVMCDDAHVRTDALWQSIVETIEFLPEETELPAAVRGPEVHLIDPGNEPRRVLSYALTEGQTDRFDITAGGSSRLIRAGDDSPWIDVPPFVTTVEQTVVAANEDGTFDIESVITGAETLDAAMVHAYEDQVQTLVGMSSRYRVDEQGRALTAETTTLPDAVATGLQPGLIDISSLQATQPLPAEPVGVGAIWEVTSEIVDPETGLAITFLDTVTLERLHADGSFELSGVVDIESPAQQLSLPGMPAEVTLTGMAEGDGTAHWIIDLARVGAEADITTEIAMTATTTRDGVATSETMEMRMEMRSERADSQ